MSHKSWLPLDPIPQYPARIPVLRAFRGICLEKWAVVRERLSMAYCRLVYQTKDSKAIKVQLAVRELNKLGAKSRPARLEEAARLASIQQELPGDIQQILADGELTWEGWRCLPNSVLMVFILSWAAKSTAPDAKVYRICAPSMYVIVRSKYRVSGDHQYDPRFPEAIYNIPKDKRLIKRQITPSIERLLTGQALVALAKAIKDDSPRYANVQ